MKGGEEESPPSQNLWVGNVSTNVTETMLRETFTKFGDIDNIITYPQWNYAFVYFKHIEHAIAAKEGLQGVPLDDDFFEQQVHGARIDDFWETTALVLPHRQMRWANVSFDDHDLAQLQTFNHSPQWVVKDGRWRDLAYDKFLPASSYFHKFIDDTKIVHSLIFDSDSFLPIPRSHSSLSVSKEKIQLIASDILFLVSSNLFDEIVGKEFPKFSFSSVSASLGPVHDGCHVSSSQPNLVEGVDADLIDSPSSTVSNLYRFDLS
ncbi:hypothetical protein SUGI_0188100 [Cryptomeria japonica]|nr:hypothetical protein SUGI_0188100 [Cryptomeria japonica]